MSNLVHFLREDLAAAWPHLRWFNERARGEATGAGRGWVVRVAVDRSGRAGGEAVLLPAQVRLTLNTEEAKTAVEHATKRKEVNMYRQTKAAISSKELCASLAELAAGLEIACEEVEAGRVTQAELISAIRDLASIARQISTEVP